MFKEKNKDWKGNVLKYHISIIFKDKPLEISYSREFRTALKNE